MSDRVNGVVTRSRTHKGVLAVLVNDENHPQHGETIVIASTRNDMVLVEGLLIDFVVGSLQSGCQRNIFVPAAVDARTRKFVPTPTSEIPFEDRGSVAGWRVRVRRLSTNPRVAAAAREEVAKVIISSILRERPEV